jgi:hypothetical protein
MIWSDGVAGLVIGIAWALKAVVISPTTAKAASLIALCIIVLSMNVSARCIYRERGARRTVDAERLLKFADGPGRRKAALRHRCHFSSVGLPCIALLI